MYSSVVTCTLKSHQCLKVKRKKKEKATEERTKVADSIKLRKFQAIFSERTVDLGTLSFNLHTCASILMGALTEKLKQLTWQGAAPQYRCKTWQLLLVHQIRSLNIDLTLATFRATLTNWVRPHGHSTLVPHT